MKAHSRFILCLALLLPLVPAVASGPSGGIVDGISASLAEAREEVRRELAATREELERNNLELDGNSVHFGSSAKKRKDTSLPKAEITPAGDFLVGGEAVPVNAHQRRDLLAYRRQVLDIAAAGIEVGQLAAEAALDAVDMGLFRLLFSAMTGSLERRVEKTVYANLEPGMRHICGSLPALLETERRLSASLPEFRPYARLDESDVEDCMDEVRRAFARR